MRHVTVKGDGGVESSRHLLHSSVAFPSLLIFCVPTEYLVKISSTDDGVSYYSVWRCALRPLNLGLAARGSIAPTDQTQAGNDGEVWAAGHEEGGQADRTRSVQE
jgi:hypothetical protein